MPDAETLGGQDLLSEIQQVQADILLSQKALPEAQAAADEAIALAVKAGKPNIEAAARVCSARCQLEGNDLASARQALDRGLQILETMTDELLAGRAAALAGRIAMGQGKFEEAEGDLRQSREILSKLGASRDLRQVQDFMRRLPKPDAKELLREFAD
jgi:hypothetical protein